MKELSWSTAKRRCAEDLHIGINELFVSSDVRVVHNYRMIDLAEFQIVSEKPSDLSNRFDRELIALASPENCNRTLVRTGLLADEF